MNEHPLQERLEEFLRTFKDEEGNMTYWKKIQIMSLDNETSITINCQDLFEFD